MQERANILHGQYCYAVVLGNKPGERIGIVVYNETGYYKTDLDNPALTIDQCKETVAHLNSRLDLSEDVAESMQYASLFGWHVPVAAPAHAYFARKQAIDAPEIAKEFCPEHGEVTPIPDSLVDVACCPLCNRATSMADTFLIQAAKTIIHQRDFKAEHGHFDTARPNPDREPDQEFDDWSADMLSHAMQQDGIAAPSHAPSPRHNRNTEHHGG